MRSLKEVEAAIASLLDLRERTRAAIAIASDQQSLAIASELARARLMLSRSEAVLEELRDERQRAVIASLR